MELGEKLKQARLEAGLSQRQLCGGEITRNMLSQIENGSAKPSMATLTYLAGRLGKRVSWFLEEQAPEQDALGRDLLLLHQAETAMAQGKDIHARELLAQVSSGDPMLQRPRILLLAKLPGADPGELCQGLPSLDEELLLRASAALAQGDGNRCEQLLAAMEEHSAQAWLLWGEVNLRREEYEAAAACFHRAEEALPGETAAKLEICYRELGDYRQAYAYACKQKNPATTQR